MSDGTIKTYKNVCESLPFNLLSNQNTILKKLKECDNLGVLENFFLFITLKINLWVIVANYLK